MTNNKVYRRSDGAVFYILEKKIIRKDRPNDFEYQLKKHGSDHKFRTNQVTFSRLYTKSKSKIDK